jgi:diguanylate cyclase (GGDEF)-like protein/PAS domain S-box-containing protein
MMGQKDLLANALASIANAILIADREGHIVWVNEAFSKLSGYSSEELLGQRPSLLKSGRQDSTFYRELWQTILGGKVWQGELVEQRKDGSLFVVEETITPLFDAKGNITHFIAIQHDITLRKRQGDKEHFLAYHDSLTGLPNRAMFLNLLRQAVEHSKAQHTLMALMFIDLDRFKPVNDELGHQIGDLVLVAVSNRLKAAVRKTDVVARIGGDEFAVIENGLADIKPVEALARELILRLGKPYRLDHHEVSIGASIGVAIYPSDGGDASLLLKRADVAMYQAKENGRNHYCFYDPLFWPKE